MKDHDFDDSQEPEPGGFGPGHGPGHGHGRRGRHFGREPFGFGGDFGERVEARLRGGGGFWRMPFGPPWGGPGPFGPGGPGHRGGRRGRRPNVRAAVLALLNERPMHGYEMITELETRTGGVWRPSPGSIYPTLQLLEDEGLIVSDEGGGRKRFTLTDAGRAEATAAGEAPWEHIGDETVENWHDMKDAIFGAMQAMKQVMTTGTDEQRRQAVEVLVDARRKLYAILAD
jgi:DNA-binding PadR family transcriptional regulator